MEAPASAPREHAKIVSPFRVSENFTRCIPLVSPLYSGARFRTHRGKKVYAIFEDGGKQYKVSEGDDLLIERRDLDDGQKEITFDKVLMVGEGADAKIGAPWVEGATVTATLTEQLKTPKVVGVKFKRRKGYMKRFGHRQQMFRVSIDKINA